MTTTAFRFSPRDPVRKLVPNLYPPTFEGPEMEVFREVFKPLGGVEVLCHWTEGGQPCMGHFGPGEIAIVDVDRRLEVTCGPEYIARIARQNAALSGRLEGFTTGDYVDAYREVTGSDDLQYDRGDGGIMCDIATIRQHMKSAGYREAEGRLWLKVPDSPPFADQIRASEIDLRSSPDIPAGGGPAPSGEEPIGDVVAWIGERFGTARTFPNRDGAGPGWLAKADCSVAVGRGDLVDEAIRDLRRLLDARVPVWPGRHVPAAPASLAPEPPPGEEPIGAVEARLGERGRNWDTGLSTSREGRWFAWSGHRSRTWHDAEAFGPTEDAAIRALDRKLRPESTGAPGGSPAPSGEPASPASTPSASGCPEAVDAASKGGGVALTAPPPHESRKAVEAALATLGMRGPDWLAANHGAGWYARTRNHGKHGRQVRTSGHESYDAAALALASKLESPESPDASPSSCPHLSTQATDHGSLRCKVCGVMVPAGSVTTEHGTFEMGDWVEFETGPRDETVRGRLCNISPRSVSVESSDGRGGWFAIDVSKIRPSPSSPESRVRALLESRGFSDPCIQFMTWSLAAKEGLGRYDVLSPAFAREIEAAWKGEATP